MILNEDPTLHVRSPFLQRYLIHHIDLTFHMIFSGNFVILVSSTFVAETITVT